MSRNISNWDYKEVFDNLQIAFQAIEKAANIANSLEHNSSIHTLICGLCNMCDNLAERLESEVVGKVKRLNQKGKR